MVKAIMHGCNGKMGQVISRIVKEDPSIEIVAGIDIYTKCLAEYPVYANEFECEEEADVIVAFPPASAVDRLLEYSVSKSLPIVIATTGCSEEQKEKMEQAARKIPVFTSANMSLGISLLTELVSRAAKVLGDQFDIEITEMHHNRKLDAPSGTALMIADSIRDSLDRDSEYIYERQSRRAAREKQEIGIHSVRGGTIVGVHSVLFAGQDELVEIKHTAQSRDLFAVGAIQAAIYLKEQKPGMYHMSDLVKSMC